MAYAVGVAEPMPRIDSTADCVHCPGTVVWDEVHGWVHTTRVSVQVAEQFMADSPHGGDLDALRVTFVSATQRTRDAVAQYRAWLAKQQGGAT